MEQAQGNPAYEVVWPLGRLAPQALPPRKPVDDLRGKNVGFLWNYGFYGDVMYAVLREEIAARYPGVNFISHEVFGDTHGPDEKQVLEALPARLRAHGVDLVISGIGA